jgi:triosephosphate isomerase
VAGNWKMNGLRADLAEVSAVCQGISNVTCDVAICPPATLIAEAVTTASGSKLMIGGQDCHPKGQGAHTGEISAEMIADAGAELVIVGHSERRKDHGETDEVVRQKAEAAWRAGLIAIVCVGETETERRSGTTLDVLVRQIAGSVPEGGTAEKLVIAYEPVWAIGSGLTPSEDDIATAHAHIRDQLVGKIGDEAQVTRILYGGSVKPSNAGALMSVSNVDGALVGGASLKAADFLGIVSARG